MTPAAIDGIARFGHGWRYSVRLSDLSNRLGDEESLRVGDAEALANQIGKRIEAFVASTPKLDDEERAALTSHVEELTDIEDDLDEVRYAMNRLYDDLDFYRVCAQ